MNRKLERVLLGIGLVLLGIFVLTRLEGRLRSQIALAEFHSANPESRADVAAPSAPTGNSHADYGLWSEKRIQAYKASLLQNFPAPLAVLKVDKINLEVPVFSGTDDLTLNRGAGFIVGTSRPGEMGNVGIAGHRDGFFRGLKDVALGDKLELGTNAGTLTYVIDKIVIVKPEDVSVLRPRSSPTLTLVTCYPFYYVGDAPQRYIVQASLAAQESRDPERVQGSKAIVKAKN